jgi:hypothetical protein
VRPETQAELRSRTRRELAAEARALKSASREDVGSLLAAALWLAEGSQQAALKFARQAVRKFQREGLGTHAGAYRAAIGWMLRHWRL